MVADWSESLLEWERELERLKEGLGRALPRRELRDSAGAFIDGLLSGAERKTAWLMAEQAGLDRSYRIQPLLGRRSWSADDLRDVVRDYALEALGDPDGVLVVDETGFLKKGEHSVGVGRQYSGAAGRIENRRWACSSPPAQRVFVFAWSLWRRIHQARAATAHYRTRQYKNLQL